MFLSAIHRKHTELQSTTSKVNVVIIQIKVLTTVKLSVMVYWVTVKLSVMVYWVTIHSNLKFKVLYYAPPKNM